MARPNHLDQPARRHPHATLRTPLSGQNPFLIRQEIIFRQPTDHQALAKTYALTAQNHTFYNSKPYLSRCKRYGLAGQSLWQGRHLPQMRDAPPRVSATPALRRRAPPDRPHKEQSSLFETRKEATARGKEKRQVLILRFLTFKIVIITNWLRIFAPSSERIEF